jgi:DNA-binding MarR family transcriptional regulator
MRATMRERDRELLAGLDEREQTELIRMLRRIYANVCKQ